MLDRAHNLIARGTQFAAVLADTLVANRGELASETTILRRLALCHSCAKFAPGTNRCTACGCHVKDEATRHLLRNLGNKVAHRASVCPDHYWGQEGDGNMEQQEKDRLELQVLELRAQIKRAEIQIAAMPSRKSQLEAEIAELPAKQAKLKEQITMQQAKLKEFEAVLKG